MPKIRGVKPDYWTDEDIVELTIPARLLFIGLWNLACDNGHITDKPKQIKMRILPADDVDVDELLNELADRDRITREDGTITIHNFAKHQKPHRRWWTTCDLPLCKVPPDAPEQGFNRSEGPSDATSQPEHNRGTTVGHGRTTADVDCEGDGDSDVEGELKVARKRRASQLPDDFTPTDQHRQLASELGLNLDFEFAKFRDHWISEGKTKVDWNATLRNWLRGSRNARPPQPATQAALPPVEESWMRAR